MTDPRHLWAVDGLALEPHHRVLEVGHGPGVALTLILDRLGPEGRVTGLDRSPAMTAAARARNPDDRLTLVTGTFEDAPPDGPFDRVLAFNVAAFHRTPARLLPRLRDVLAPDGRAHLLHQFPGAARPAPALDAATLGEHGLALVDVLRAPDLQPYPAVGVVATPA